ncbi:hypothetical protein Q9S36_31735 [Microbacterium sp. ARD31]|uniref:hypothetical protein n=1 Tax=Microbacterium sp. ARD31 TaxID=2962576 RepID=UPI0028811C79|nr:hypothetical protein [Microbacterium sp. ARD31]MDT0184766.1 hypothetical protein [Microbacterium sp. ARD31]
MAEQTTPLASTIRSFDSARGEEMDGVWAFGVSWSLMMRDVDPSLVDEGLREALDIVRSTQESPEVLFGTATEHADALYEQWRSEGRLVLRGDVTTWREGVAMGLGLGLATGVAYALLLLLRDDAGTVTVLRGLGVALAVGLGGALLHTAWSRRHLRRPPRPGETADLRWSLELAEILRTRCSMSGARVRDVLAEADAHARDAGRSLEDEFGTPQEYAARFAPDLVRRSRWRFAGFVAMALLTGAFFVDGPTWSTGLITAIWTWWAVRERRHGVAQARRRR